MTSNGSKSTPPPKLTVRDVLDTDGGAGADPAARDPGGRTAADALQDARLDVLAEVEALVVEVELPARAPLQRDDAAEALLDVAADVHVARRSSRRSTRCRAERLVQRRDLQRTPARGGEREAREGVLVVVVGQALESPRWSSCERLCLARERDDDPAVDLVDARSRSRGRCRARRSGSSSSAGADVREVHVRVQREPGAGSGVTFTDARLNSPLRIVDAPGGVALGRPRPRRPWQEAQRSLASQTLSPSSREKSSCSFVISTARSSRWAARCACPRARACRRR